MASRRIPNQAGASDSYLKAVTQPVSAGKFKSALGSKEKALAEEVVAAIYDELKAQRKQNLNYQIKVDSKLSDAILGRIADLLDEVKNDFTSSELNTIKEEIITKIEETNDSIVSAVVKSLIVSLISSFFDNTATKDDLEQLKSELIDVIKGSSSSESQSVLTDDKEGDYQNSTPALNFATIETKINNQLERLSTNMSKVTGVSAKGICSKVMTRLQGVTKSLSAKMANGFKTVKVLAGAFKSKLAGLGSFLGKMISPKFAAVAGGIAAVAGGIAAVAGGIAAVAGGISKLNPFSRKKKDKKKKEAASKSMKDMVKYIYKCVHKIYEIIEPFIDKVKNIFNKVIKKFVIMPIVWIMAKITAIVAAVVIAGVLLFFAYKYIKEKLVAAWQWIVDLFKVKLPKYWQKAKDWVVKLWNNAVDGVKKIWDKVVKWFKDAWAAIKGTVIKWWDKAVEWIVGIWTGIKDWALGIWDGVKNWIVGIWDKMMAKIKAAWDWLKNLPTRLKNWFIKSVVNKIIDCLNALKEKLSNMSFNIPWLDFKGSVKPWKWEVISKTVKPLGFLAGKPLIERVQPVSTGPKEGEGDMKPVVEQSVAPKFDTVNALANRNTVNSVEFSAAAKDIGIAEEKKNAQLEEQLRVTKEMNSNMMNALNGINGKLDGQKPTVVPMPVPVNPGDPASWENR